MADLPDTQPATKANILLVDDRPANLLSLRTLLEDLGQPLVDACSGEEAIQKVQSDDFAVILLDVMMPGIGGFEAAKFIRGHERSQHTPIIFLTANDMDRTQLEEGYALGAVDFLVKPLVPGALHAKVRGFVELYQDKRRAMQEADQLRLLVQGTKDYAIFMLDPQGRVVTWNAGAERLKGYRAEEIIGQHFSRFYPPEALDRGWPEHELRVATAEGRFEDEGWRLRKDGSQFWANVVITALRDEQGRLRGFSKVTRDLTLRKRAEESLRQSEEKFRLLVDNVKDYAIFLLDPQGNVASWNRGAERLTRYKADEIIGQHFSRFYPQEAIDRGWPAHELKVATREGRFEDEGWRLRKDGTRFWANVVITALKDDHGGPRGFSKITRDLTQRKKAEEDARRLLEESTARRVAEENAKLIQEQRERLHVTLSSIGDAVISTDAEGRVDFLNPIAQALVGWSEKEARNRTLGEVFHIVNEETRQPVENPALKALQEGVVVGLANHTVLIDRNGGEHPIDDSAAPIRDFEGRVVGSVLVFRDISQRKALERSLRQSEQRFRGLMEQAPFSVQVFTPDGRTARVNRAWEELWGVTLDQLGDYKVLEDRQLEAKGVSPYLRRAFAGEPVEIPAIEYDPNETVPNTSRHKDPRRWVSAVAYPLKDESGAIREVVLVHQDITARRRAEEERELFAFLVQNSHDFIGMCDADLRPLFVNREGIRLVGLDSLDEALRTPVLEFFFPEDRTYLTEQFFPQVVRDGFGETEIRFRHFKTGQPIWFTYSVLALRDAAGKPNGFATISRDITRLKEANQALQQADRRKDEFLATLAHELRNPLAPIRNSLQVLKMPRVDPTMAEQTRAMMERQVHHLVRLVDDLLDVSRVMRGKIELRRESVELATIIARAVETVKPLIDVQGHDLNLSVTWESLLLDADPVRLTQVVGNLLTNSAKYTDPNGRIWLTASRDGDQALLIIRDSGIGIAPDMLPHIFELFVQADHASTKSQGGLGIGLTLVKNLVEMHGGSVAADSAGLGKGSEFTLRLPLVAPAETSAGARDDSKSAPQSSGHRLLIVDDNHDAALSLAMVLRLQGHEVRVAHDGPTALDTATKFQPDVIFLDIGMPGMDGYEVARRVRKTAGIEKTVLAALTGWGQQEDRRRSAEAGFDHHLVKPPEPSLIEKLLADLKTMKQAPLSKC